eukprot:GFUD01033242.1.p1 GENE.GFUD01033242.1~~GFUD01033242.1.p1  ORF type:complete len:525 (+),score=146.87 GFUD01033242.1:71-1645(+)
MELPDNFGEFKSEFAKQIAMEDEKAKNLNIWLLKGQHSLRRGTSESVLGRGKQQLPGHQAFKNSNLRGSVGSLPSLVMRDNDVLVDDGEEWVTSDQFKDILEQKEKEVSQVQTLEEGPKKDVKRLEEENAELRKRLQLAGRRSSSVSLVGVNKYQELQRDVAKLQAKICKMEQSSEHPSSTRRLVSFLETFKSQLPSDIDSPGEKYESVLDSLNDSYRQSRPSIDSYRPSVQSFGRPSMGSYRAACHPSPYRDELFRPQQSRGVSCVAQFRRENAGEERVDVLAGRAGCFGDMLGSEEFSSLKYDKVDETKGDTEAKLSSMRSRPFLPRTRVVMGAKSVQRARDRGGMRSESCKAFSSSDLLGECRMRGVDIPSISKEVFGEETPQSLNKSMKTKSKSYSNGLSFREAVDVGCGDSGRGTDADASQSLNSSMEMEKGFKEELGIGVKNDKVKDESKVQKFFKRLRKLVTKEAKSNNGKEEEVTEVKMTRSLSQRIGKSKNLPKRLKSFHCSSSPRLRKDFYLKD